MADRDVAADNLRNKAIEAVVAGLKLDLNFPSLIVAETVVDALLAAGLICDRAEAVQHGTQLAAEAIEGFDNELPGGMFTRGAAARVARSAAPNEGHTTEQETA